MKWFKNIKRFLFLKKLRSDVNSLAKSPREMLNIGQAKKIGILLDAKYEEDIITVSKYAESLSQKNKEVSILSFQNNKEKEDNDSRFLNKLDVNWFDIPSQEKIDDFQQQNLDILIAAFVNECLPLEYVLATSNARFRVGAFNDSKSDYFELMINTKKDASLKYLLQQIDHFLHTINP